MHTATLEKTARAIVAGGRGILAADESTGTIGKRFATIGVENTEANRLAYRELLFTTPEIGRHVSGVICYDETIRQTGSDGRSLVRVMQDAGMIPGIKVDTGAMLLAGSPKEKITEGLDGLRERLAEYHKLGARFAKWRAVIAIADDIPTDYCVATNAHALARYAALCQEAGIVPIVEPEVLMDGAHDIERCYDVTAHALERVFAELSAQHVTLEGMLLKPNMIVSGTECKKQAGVSETANLTLQCLRRHVPAAVPGIVFLSGGQSDEKATEHLNAMNTAGSSDSSGGSGGRPPWVLSFSYGRALQASCIKAWGGKAENVARAQQALLHRARMNSAAARGEYLAAMEKVA